MNILQKFEQQQVEKLTNGKSFSDFSVGDTVKVNVKITEGTNERIQACAGVVIAKKKKSINSSFIVRKISHGVWVERKFMLYAPVISSIEVLKYGIVRRAKIYYLRKLSGKAARIKEKLHSRNKTKK